MFLLISLACGFGLLLRSDTGSSGRLGISLQSTQVLLLVVAALWIVVYLDRVAVFTALSERLSPGAFDPDAAPDLPDRWRERLGYLRGSQGSNLSVYAQQAPTAPFTGFGPAVHTWSVSSRLAPASPSSPAPGLRAGDVYAGLRPAGQQAGYEVSDLVLMPGWLPDGHPFLDPARAPSGAAAGRADRRGPSRRIRGRPSRITRSGPPAGRAPG